MSRSFLGIAASLLIVSIVPVAAHAQSASSSTSSGVQVIDMNPQPHKAVAKPSKAPSAAPELPGASALLHNALSYVGTPYRKGGQSPSGFDSAGLSLYAFASIGINIPRMASQQFFMGRQITGDPLPGDLVFFQTTAYGASDVGIYLGDGKFLTAFGKDVHVDSFATDYFKSRYLGARRYL